MFLDTTLLFKQGFIIFNFMCIYFSCMYHVSAVPTRGQKRTGSPAESYESPCLLGTELGFSSRAASAEPSHQPQCDTFGSEVSLKAVFRKLGPNLWLSSEVMGPLRPSEKAIVMLPLLVNRLPPTPVYVRLGISTGSEQQIQMTGDRNSEPCESKQTFPSLQVYLA